MQKIRASTNVAPPTAESNHRLRDDSKVRQGVKASTQGFSNTRKERANTQKELKGSQWELPDTKLEIASSKQKLPDTAGDIADTKQQLAIVDIKLQLASASSPIAYSKQEPIGTDWELVMPSTSGLTPHSMPAEGPKNVVAIHQDTGSVKHISGWTWPELSSM